MSLSYDVFTGAFLSKINEFELLKLDYDESQELIDEYMKRAIGDFKKNCKYDLISTRDDESREFNVDINDGTLDEIVNIVSEGMVVQWLKPYVYSQENLQNAISTRDFSMYSPAELLMRVGNAYKQAQKDYTQMIREYSFNNNDLTVLHL